MPKKLSITSKKDGFRRGGVAHSGEETLYDLDHFTKEQREAIENEPMLIVHEKDVPAEKESGSKKGEETPPPPKK